MYANVYLVGVVSEQADVTVIRLVCHVSDHVMRQPLQLY